MELAFFSVFMGEYLMVNTHLHSLSDQDQNEQEREGIGGVASILPMC